MGCPSALKLVGAATLAALVAYGVFLPSTASWTEMIKPLGWSAVAATLAVGAYLHIATSETIRKHYVPPQFRDRRAAANRYAPYAYAFERSVPRDLQARYLCSYVLIALALSGASLLLLETSPWPPPPPASRTDPELGVFFVWASTVVFILTAFRNWRRYREGLLPSAASPADPQTGQCPSGADRGLAVPRKPSRATRKMPSRL